MKNITWFSDGHQIMLELNKNDVRIVGVLCPRAGNCRHRDADCVVDWFIDRYGLECNVGVCDMAPAIEIAWAIIDGERDLDDAQVWVIPVNDPTFSGWYQAMMEPELVVQAV